MYIHTIFHTNFHWWTRKVSLQSWVSKQELPEAAMPRPQKPHCVDKIVASRILRCILPSHGCMTNVKWTVDMKLVPETHSTIQDCENKNTQSSFSLLHFQKNMPTAANKYEFEWMDKHHVVRMFFSQFCPALMPYVSLCIITLWYCRNIRQLRWNYWCKQCWLMLCHETHCPGSVLGLDQLTPNGKKTCSKVRIFQEKNDFPLCHEKRINVLQGASRWMRVWFSRSMNQPHTHGEKTHNLKRLCARHVAKASEMAWGSGGGPNSQPRCRLLAQQPCARLSCTSLRDKSAKTTLRNDQKHKEAKDASFLVHSGTFNDAFSAVKVPEC